MPITNVRAVIAVAEHDAALLWYERLFGRPADLHPMDGLAEWDLTSSGGLQVQRDADLAGSSQATLIVDDLDASVAELHGRGIETPDITVGSGAQFVQLTDPEGNAIVFAAALLIDS